MIEEVYLRNFRSIREDTIHLGALNVLIGRNGTGKSNFLSFFHLLGEGARERLNHTLVNELRGFEFLRHLNPATPGNVEWEITFQSEREGKLYYKGMIGPRGVAGYSIQSEIVARPPFPGYDDPYKFLEVRDGHVNILKVYRNGQSEPIEDEDATLTDQQELAITQIRNPTRYPSIEEIYRDLREWIIFTGFGEQELRQVRNPQTLNVVNPLQLDPNGSNLVSVLHELANNPRYERTYDRLNEIMRSVFPDFKQFDLPVAAGSQASLSFRSKDLPISVPALFMSDGQLRFLGLVILLLLPQPPKLILIDEPEIGMHPKMIDIFAELLISASERTQLIVSTHSPQLIDSLLPEHLLIVERENGETKINRPERERLDRWLERYKPGYLWTHTTLLES